MALQREAILERGIDVAAGAAEADHRVLLVRLVLRAPDQVGVFVGLEVRQAHDHRLRRHRGGNGGDALGERSEEHTSELQSLMRISYAVFCLKKKIAKTRQTYSTYMNTDTKL